MSYDQFMSSENDYIQEADANRVRVFKRSPSLHPTIRWTHVRY
ncbi:Acetylglutamate kinase [Crocosphaera watsonii WH 0402]|uniref:Acetylglutamate kinase n=1 Tax=Crocosphaera watsonii WH 0402 TaxID=1284629 RepID=T2JWD0_CROWT|nr:Acetylglutamate kinase [Crocosphaera watsonii WH 0402]